MSLDPALREQILAAVPSLRAFAISLSGNVDRADDLVQETLLRALANIHSFQPGTNMPAWLFTILRNLFRSEYRKRRREVEDADGSYADTLKTHPEQTSHVEFKEFSVALSKLPEDQREALILRKLLERLAEFLELHMPGLLGLRLQRLGIAAVAVLDLAPPLAIFRPEQVAENREKPCRHVRSRLERIDIGHGAQQRFLHEIVRPVHV
ncbi:MAG: hypothetical protein QOE50_819, partial [Sphingomonadales bacterium]|nr:hypothetical protein [Sphingomonadales bacterium]